MNVLQIIFFVAALVCFILAAVGVPAGRVNLIAAGLACWLFAQVFLKLLA